MKRVFGAKVLPVQRETSLRKAREFNMSHGRDFYKVAVNQNGDVLGKTVMGTIINQSVDLRTARPKDIVDVPFEITVGQSLRDFWQAGFYSYDRISSSTPFARSLGLQDQVIPFHLMLFLSGAMSHADSANYQVGFHNAVYHWPAFAGDTFKKRFVIRKLRTTSDDKRSVVTIHCQLSNQRDVVVFSCEKTMMFPFRVQPSVEEVSAAEVAHKSFLLDHLVQQASALQERGSQTLHALRPGQLLLHTLTRPLTLTHSMQLASLVRLTHSRHFDTRTYSADQLLVPGGLVLGLTCSLAARDLHEVSVFLQFTLIR